MNANANNGLANSRITGAMPARKRIFDTTVTLAMRPSDNDVNMTSAHQERQSCKTAMERGVGCLLTRALRPASEADLTSGSFLDHAAMERKCRSR